MARTVDEKLAGFRTPSAGPNTTGIVLPKAFAANTLKGFGIIPEGARVCAEQGVQGRFYLSWFDGDGKEHNANASRDEIDLAPVMQAQRAALLKDISTEDLQEEIRLRKVASAGKEATDAK